MASVRVIPDSTYYSGQGQLILARRDPATGRPVEAYQVGNAPDLELQVSTTQVDHKESMSGQRAVDMTLLTEVSATVNVTLESVTLRNLVAATYGSLRNIDGGEVTTENHEVTADTGITPLMHPNISDYTFTDGTDPIDPALYDVDEEFGVIYWNKNVPTPYTGPLVAAYDYEARTTLDALTQVAPPERYLRFHGINTIDGNLYLVEMPRVQFQPLQSYNLITEEIAQVQMTATLLPDPFLTTGSR